MDLGDFTETVIIIDTDFLNRKIKSILNTYSERYPEKIFLKINTTKLISFLPVVTNVFENGRFVDIIFCHQFENDILFFCNPNSLKLKINGAVLKKERGNFKLKTLFADKESNQSNIDHFNEILNSVYLNSNVARIVMVADNVLLNDVLNNYLTERKKVLFVLKDKMESKMNVRVRKFSIDTLIHIALGLKLNEI
jgi:hypothetical protein